ncbi:DedA family protein [Angustibacter sp. McL0619]|uniref:DedA family protein n=1 Tax=Angustibacter sp. McL0619 TaxID=3415676 RepID=UPI003CEF91F0
MPLLHAATVRWRSLSWRRKAAFAAGALAVLVCCVAAVQYMATGDGITFIDPSHPGRSYLAVFVLVALDAVIPIFPGETTLNAASTAAAQGRLELWPIVVMGALGAIAGDSALFWLARRYSRRIEPQVDRARANANVRQALDLMDSSAPALIVGGRYVPGMRFVVNATMGLSRIAYRRFLLWSVLSGVLWSVYTCAMAYWIGLSLGEYPLASVVVSGLVTTVALAIVFLSMRRHRRTLATRGRTAP